MDKPPRGKHSTKGLGQKMPQESEFVKWKDDVVVPCGKPVPSNVRATELMYNEYIVYNTAQVGLTNVCSIYIYILLCQISHLLLRLLLKLSYQNNFIELLRNVTLKIQYL